MISLSHVTLTFPDGEGTVVAVHDASIEVQRGVVAGITGPSGSGKSSLLAVAATLIPPSSGTVQVDGVDASGLSARDRSRLRRESLGIVFQQSNLIPALTSVDQLIVMSKLGITRITPTKAAVRARALDLLDQVGLSGARGKRPAQLSGGERQRVNIARALMNAPGTLIIDEPTSSLDQERGAQIFDLILRLSADHDTATIVVTHDADVLARAHQRYGMLDGVLTTRV